MYGHKKGTSISKPVIAVCWTYRATLLLQVIMSQTQHAIDKKLETVAKKKWAKDYRGETLQPLAIFHVIQKVGKRNNTK